MTNTSPPMTTDGSPSRRKSHCQPRQPLIPSMYSMMAPEIGAPITFEMATDVMKSATALARREPGNQ
jgi:hypothetical protein